MRIYQVVIRLPALLQCLQAKISPEPRIADLIEQTYTNNIEQYTLLLQKLEELVVTTIDLKALDNHEYIIKAEFNEELQSKSRRKIFVVYANVDLLCHDRSS